MKKTPLVTLFVLALAACDKTEAVKVEEAPIQAKAEEKAAPTPAPKPEADDPHAGLAKYDIEKVEQLLAKSEVVPVDANSPDTREEYGTLPGAVLLTSSREFETSELPSDKSKDLVFYCGNEQCRAAPKAAKRAQESGYENVHVMPAGIRGWVKAGKRVDHQS
jgi:rhodanese-related sulfurtransferase